MRKYATPRFLSIALAVLLVLLAVSVGSMGQALAAVSPQVSGTLPPDGGFAAYTFSYPGNDSKVGVQLTYSPSDDPQDKGLANGRAVTLEAYSPTAPPPNGKPIAAAGGNGGTKFWQLQSGVGGTYTIIVSNWDSLHRPVQFTLTTLEVPSSGNLADATPGPALTFVSGSVPQPAVQATPTPPVSPPPVPTAVPTSIPPTNVVSGTLPPGGGWSAYSISYATDDVKVGVQLTYSPSNDPQDAGLTNGRAVILDGYSPTALPPDGKPIGSAGGNNGTKFWQLPPTGPNGTYILIVQNWDSLHRPVQFTLTSVEYPSSGTVANATAGLPLTFVSSSP